MSSSQMTPRLLKGGIVTIDPRTSAVRRVVPLQYNPDTLTRTLQPQGVGADGADRSEALRLKGPPVETIKLEAEIDATDLMEKGDPNVAQFGIFPQLAALETLVYPTSDQLLETDRQARAGVLEVAPMEAPLTLFVWSKHRVLPVRLTEFSVTEEAFDANLNPIRAKVSLGMRVLSVADLGFAHKGGGLFLIYQQQKERLAATGAVGGFGTLGIGGIP